jgi:O-antigen ligase
MASKGPRRYRLGTVVTAGATAAALILVVHYVDFDKILPTLQRLRPTTIAIVTAFMLVNLVFAFFRFERTLAAFGATISWRAAAHAFALGTLAGQFLFNVIGQSLTRAMVLRSAGVPMSLTVVATYIERLAALGVLGLAAVVAALILFGSVGFELHTGGAYFLSLGVGMTIVLGIAGVRAAAAVLTREHVSQIAVTTGRLLPALALNILVFAAMFGAYFVLALDFAPGVNWSKLAAAIVLVMFAAGIPISWAGWGLREFGAVYVLSAIGVSSEAAVIIAVTIGALGLLVTLFVGAAAMFDGWRRPIAEVPAAEFDRGNLPAMDTMLFLCIGILTACLIYFQLHVPTRSDIVAVNVADPLAMTTLFFAIYLVWKGKFLELFPRQVLYGIGAIALVFLSGAVIASMHLGLTQWALLNRLLGFAILVGYACVGGMVMSVAGERGRVVLANTFVNAALLICAVEIVAYLIHLYVTPLPLDFFGLGFKGLGQLEGYAQNANAFAFQLLMAMSVLIAVGQNGSRPRVISWPALGVLALLVVIVVGRSRAGILCGFVGASMAVVLHYWPFRAWVDRKKTASILLGTALIAAIAVIATIEWHSSIESVLEAWSARFRINVSASDALRWQTVSAGLEQWLRFPVFGQGLGSFILERRLSGIPLLVIHSDPIWFLAEMGIVGFAGYAFFMASLARWAFTGGTPNGRKRGVLIAVTLLALMGLVHDIFFQRTFWFAIGLMLPAVVAGKSEVPSDRHGNGSLTDV